VPSAMTEDRRKENLHRFPGTLAQIVHKFHTRDCVLHKPEWQLRFCREFQEMLDWITAFPLECWHAEYT
jgi:hypothetical protein